jgi:hypothetical protein
MKSWKCKSKILKGEPCPHECKVKALFEPRGCVGTALFQEWEEIKSENEIEWISIKDDKKPTYYSLKLIKTTDEKNPILVCWRANDGEEDIYTIAGSDIIFDNLKITHWADLPK